MRRYNIRRIGHRVADDQPLGYSHSIADALSLVRALRARQIYCYVQIGVLL